MHQLTAAMIATVLVSGLTGLAVPASAVAHCPDPAHPIESWTGVDRAVGTTTPVVVSLGVETEEGCDVDRAVARLRGPRATYRVALSPGPPAEGHVFWEGSVRLDPRTLRDTDAGEWDLRYDVSGDDVVGTQGDVAKIRRATRLSLDATPVRCDRVRFTGRLERASWSAHRYAGISREVLVRAPGEGGEGDDADADDVVALRTGKDGRYARTVASPGADRYWANFAGDAVSAPRGSRVDFVDEC